MKHGLSQCARLASFRLLCSNTSLHWLLKQVALHSMDYVSPTSCSIPFLVLLGTGIFFFYFCILFSFFVGFIFFVWLGGVKHERQQKRWTGISERAKAMTKYHLASAAPLQHLPIAPTSGPGGQMKGPQLQFHLPALPRLRQPKRTPGATILLLLRKGSSGLD